MNAKNARHILGLAVLCASTACCHVQTEATKPAQRSACADYGSLTASLAEETIRCTGTIGPNSFFVNERGQLQNRFTTCSIAPEEMRAASLARVTKLIALQNFRSALPRLQECLTDRFARWSELFARTKLQACPVWKETAVIGEISTAGAAQHGKMQPHLAYVSAYEKGVRPGSAAHVAPAAGHRPPPDLKPSPDQRFVDIQVPSKSSIVYEISYPQPEPNCTDPAVCAAQCAAFLPGFVLSAAGNQLVADPASWYRDNTFNAPCWVAGSNDPFCPPNFTHQMGLYSTTSGSVPPGDVYGNPNRAQVGEQCVRWAFDAAGNPSFPFITDLVLECTDPAHTQCLSRCGN